MTTRWLFFLIAAFIADTANAQNEYFLEPVTWGFVSGFQSPDWWEESFTNYYTAGDTTINDTTWKKVYSSGYMIHHWPLPEDTYSYAASLTAFVHSEGSKMYRRTNAGLENDLPVLDFDLDIGDTIEVMYIQQCIDLSISPGTFLISSIDSIFISGEWRKVFNSDCGSVIEGIGPSDALFFYGSGEQSGGMTCFGYGPEFFDVGAVISPSSGECHFALEIQELTDNRLKIFPNPSSGQVSLVSYSGAIQNVEVYNSSGDRVRSISVNALTAMIDLSDLPAGIYLAKAVPDSATGTSQILIIE